MASNTLDYSIINHNLLVGKTPRSLDYELLKDMGITLLINMRIEWPSKYITRQKLIKEVWASSIDSKYYPLNKPKMLRIAKVANSEIKKGGKVYVYCREGRHRSIVMVATILMLQGHSTQIIQKTVSQKRPVADLRAVEVASAISELA